jgi:hypothetical protein
MKLINQLKEGFKISFSWFLPTFSKPNKVLRRKYGVFTKSEDSLKNKKTDRKSSSGGI